MDEDLKEALETIVQLRATLELAAFDREQITAKEIRKDMKDAYKVLKKHGMEEQAHDHQRP